MPNRGHDVFVDGSAPAVAVHAVETPRRTGKPPDDYVVARC